MSMLDSFFNKGFRGSKCKTLLKLTIPRIKLLRNRRELQLRQMRKEIAKLLETGQEATARIRVEHIVREENMMAAQEIIELFSELISVRLPIIENQRECPLDLKEAISSLCFAAPRCADLPELMQVQMAFASKYGKEFVAAATELMPDCGVNRQLIELLSVRAPSADKKITLLKEIAEENGVDWDPAASETELFKSHEDLLDGSTQYITGNKVPLPKEKHQEVLQSVSSKLTDEQYDSDSGLDFPEVPTSIMRPNAASEESHLPSAPHPELNQTPPIDSEKLSHQTSKEPEQDEYLGTKGETPKQFVPFISAPSLPPHQSATSFRETSPDFKSSPVNKHEADPFPQYPQKDKKEKLEPSTNFDLKDVLFAAQAAADSAERAASAARSAASLAQLRISELSSQSHEPSPNVLPDNPFGMDNSILSATTEEEQPLHSQISSAGSDESTKATHSVFERQTSDPFSYDSSKATHSVFERQTSDPYSYDSPKDSHSVFERQTSDPFVTASSAGPTFDRNESLEVNSLKEPPRVGSEDDLLGSYPNLFGSGGSSFTEKAHSNK